MVKALSSGTIKSNAGRERETTAKVCATISSGHNNITKAVKYVRDVLVKCQSEVEWPGFRSNEKNQTLTLYIEEEFSGRWID